MGRLEENVQAQAGIISATEVSKAPIPAVRGPIHSPALNCDAIGQTAYEYRATAVHTSRQNRSMGRQLKRSGQHRL
jgi:hypothetical protein